MKKISLSLIVGFLFLLIGCKGDMDPAVQKAHDEVMVIHDAVMPEMGTMRKLRKKLDKQIEDRQLAGTELENVNKMIQDLKDSDEAMMEWMHQFDMPKEASKEELLSYLADQKKKMEDVDVLMRTSMSNAEKQLNEE